MSTETNEELVKKIKAGEDVAGNMAKLWQQNKNFVYSIARKYGESEIDDLMQEGYLGMYRAVGNYDLSAGTSFLSYAGFWIKQAIQRYHQENNTSTSRFMRRKIFQSIRNSETLTGCTSGKNPQGSRSAVIWESAMKPWKR